MEIIQKVTTNFLGNCKAENYHDMVADLVQLYKGIGWNMSLKAHFLDFHLDFFPENLMGSKWLAWTFPLWKSSTKASGVPVGWLIIAGHLQEMLHKQNIAESHTLLLFSNVYTLCAILKIQVFFILWPQVTQKPYLIEKKN